MEFRETLLAAQRNQQQKSSENCYYKARFDPPKKEHKQKDRLSANIQKFLAKKDEEEKQKKLEVQRKREELLAMRDPKAIRKIQKTLKVIKSANKSVIQDAVDRDNTAVTREGPDQPDQDDYGYESQEAAALYAKMMLKYSKIPDEPKFPTTNKHVKKDLNGTRERVKHALQHEDEPVPHKRRRKTENGERDSSPPTAYEPEKKKDIKPEKSKIRKPAPPPMDFNQLLKLAEQKKSEPLEVVTKKTQTESEPERLMTKKQKREYEEEMARRQRRQERLEAEKGGRRGDAKLSEKEDRPAERDRKPESGGFNRIPKLSDKNNVNHRNDSPRPSDRDKVERERAEKLQREKDRVRIDRDKKEKERLDRDRIDKLKAERDRIDRELERDRLDKLKAERERIERDIDRLNRDRERLEKTKLKLENSKLGKPIDKLTDKSKLSSKEQSIKQDIKKSIDLKSQNTYRIDKNSDDKKFVPQRNGDNKQLNGHSSQGKSVPKLSKDQVPQRNGMKDKVIACNKPNGLPESSKGVPRKPDDRKPVSGSKPQAAPSKSAPSNFDFDKHMNSLGKNGQKPMNKNGSRLEGSRQFPPGDVRRKMHPDDARRMHKRRGMPSDSEYDSEMDDFIDDGDENMDYSRHIKEIFGYDKSKYRDVDDDDDPMMESSFSRQQREEYISKKIGIMEDLEDMRMEAMEKKKTKKKRRISDDD